MRLQMRALLSSLVKSCVKLFEKPYLKKALNNTQLTTDDVTYSNEIHAQYFKDIQIDVSKRFRCLNASSDVCH